MLTFWYGLFPSQLPNLALKHLAELWTQSYSKFYEEM